MPREPNEKSVEAKRLYESGMKLVDIAKKLDVPAGTVRRWKSTYLWDGDNSERSKKKSERSEKKKKASERKKEAVEKEVNQVLDNPDLTDKQRLFCLYYIKCFNATKAYQRAYGCSYSAAATEGCNSLKNPKIAQAIRELKQGRMNQAMLEPEDIFQKYMDIAYADITEYLTFGQKEIEYVDKAGNGQTTVVSFVDLNDSSNVDGTILSEVSQGKEGVKVKLADRMKALQWLSDHMEIATEKQKAEIALLKAKVQPDDLEENADDGFLEALNGLSAEDWLDEED